MKTWLMKFIGNNIKENKLYQNKKILKLVISYKILIKIVIIICYFSIEYLYKFYKYLYFLSI